MYGQGVFYSQPAHFGHFGRKCTSWGFLILSWYILAILGQNVPIGGFLFSAGTFSPFWAKMYRLGGFSFLAGIFWPFWAKMYQLGVFYSQPVHFGHFGRKCTDWGFLILSWYILAILGQSVPTGGILFSFGIFCPFWAKLTDWGCFILSRYILAILGQSVPTGGFLFSFGTFRPFWAKMYEQGAFYSQPAHFGHFGRKCTIWGFLILSWYILAILGQNVPTGGFLFSAGTFSPF